MAKLNIPKYANIPGCILYNKNISPAARDTYCQLRGLAWGKTETPPIDMKALAEQTGKSQSTLYEHMRLLRHLGALLWRPAGNSDIIFSFSAIDGIGHSEKSETLNRFNKRIAIASLRVNKSINGNSEKSENKFPKKNQPKRKLDYLD